MDTTQLAAKVEQARVLLLDVVLELELGKAVAKPASKPAKPTYTNANRPPRFAGDMGALRKALWENNFHRAARGSMFHDKHDSWRRIKLWFASDVFDASQVAQEQLAADIRLAYGERLIKMGFTKTENWTGGQWSLCIWLEK